MSFVDRLLSHLDMPSMVKFRLRCGGHILGQKRGGVSIKCVADWICALLRSNVQELDIGFDCVVQSSVFFPPILFSSESLVALKLNLSCTGKNMQTIPDSICLPNLKIIHFKGVHFSNDGSVGKLISSCPVLEDLVLDRCYFIGDSVRFSVSNKNLKTLTLKDIILSGEGEKTHILMNAPSFLTLNHHVSYCYYVEFVDVKSLSEAIITSNLYVPTAFFTTTSDAISWIQNVKALRICFFNARDLQHSTVPIPLFEKMAYLKIWFQECPTDPIGFDPIGLEYFLARCVVLETLVFEVDREFNISFIVI